MTLHNLSKNHDLYPASGVDSNFTSVNKFGQNTDIAQDSTEEIWDGSATYVWPTSAVITRISQTADQEAMRGETIEVQGLDANWAEVTQEIDLDGTLTTTAVEITTPLIRVFRMKVQANVVIDSPVRAHNTAENQDYAIISIGNNQTLMAIYTTPADKVAYITNYWAHHNPTTGQSFTSNPIKLWMRDNASGFEKQLKHLVGIAEDGHFQHFFEPHLKVSAQTDIFITASPVGKAADISAGFDLILMND